MKELAAVLAVLAVLRCPAGQQAAKEQRAFPPNFMLGIATAAFQIEGAWNESGKGESIWDRFTHDNPEKISGGHNADVSCDSYHKFKQDVALVKEMGMSVYRFSLSWSRLLPEGRAHKINQDGVRYYNELIDEILRNDITPMVTLYHWDLPQALQDIGGWPNPLLAEYFAEYAEFVFVTFGDRVGKWITFNEPLVTCVEGYGLGGFAPGIKGDGWEYLCTHTVLKAHARAYRIYEQSYKSDQKGVVGIGLNSMHVQPRSEQQRDREAAETLQQFWLGWFAHPIFSKEGDYPAVMKQRVAAVSRAQGLRRSRLPEFSKEEIEEIRGSADFFGLNTYTSRLAHSIETPNEEDRSKDHLVATSMDPAWNETVADWFRVVPWGLRGLLVWIRDHYDNPLVLVTENGFPDHGEIYDVQRVRSFQSYVKELLLSVHSDHCNVQGYIAWSLLDNFEWTFGYTHKFGLVHVDFDDPARTRTPKLSYNYWSFVTKHKRLPSDLELEEIINKFDSRETRHGEL